jgi:DNA-binding NarL/FixJ family response regulator
MTAPNPLEHLSEENLMRPGNERPESILVVDEDDDLRNVVSQALAPLGRTVRSAATAAEAMAAVRRERPSLVLLDIRLPDLSGYVVCRQLRDEFGDELAIVFLSGCRTEDFDRAAGLMLGADDYLVKPFAMGELLARVRRAIGRSSPQEAAPDASLTPREREVLRLLAEGLSQALIAQRLVISPNTVAKHIQRILTKLNLHSRAEAVAFANRHRL